ncbi:MAG: MFS transporter [Anaerolineae bacterium]|nr:MFS transporter [Anaerolineae bacterium]
MTDQALHPSGQPTHTTRTAWLILAVLLLFSIAAPLNQFKVPPIMPVLMDVLGISVSSAGLLMSVFAITGLFLALPAGLIFQRAGLRVTGLLAGGSIIIGAVLGAISQSMTGLLLSRVIEGIGTSFMAVLAPALIGQWFPAAKRGTAMGIWSAWVPVGTVSMLIVAPALVAAAGWRSVWWLGAGYALIVTTLYLAFVRAAPAASAQLGADQPPGLDASVGVAPRESDRLKPRVQLPRAKSSAREPGVKANPALRNRDIWLLAAAFGAFNAAVIGMATYLPTFLATRHGLALGPAAWIASIINMLTIFSAPAGGILSDRIGSRKKPYLVGFMAALILLPLVGIVNLSGVFVLVVAIGLTLGVIPTNIFASAVEAAGDPHQGGAAMAVIMVGQNAGMLLGPLIFGTLVESAGWSVAFALLAILAAAGLVAGWLAKTR